MKTRFPSRLAFPLCSAIAAMLAVPSVHAGQIWDGSGGDNNWNTAGNWDGDLLPIFTNAITFVGNTRNGAVNNLTADSIIGGINLTNDGTVGKTNAFTLSNTRITLGGNITTTASSSAITDTISLDMILNADRTITTNTNHNLTVSGIISQTGGTRRLTKDGAGILTLSNANTYSGGTTITAGTLNVTNVSGLGASGSTLSINGASTTRLSTDTAFGGANPVYNMLMFGGGSYTGTIELNRATAGASTGITHNFGLLTITLNGGQPATLNVTAGANAPGALDTIAFTSVNAGNNNTVTETLNPTGGNITIGTLTAAGNSLVTMALSGTTAGNAITGVIGGTVAQQNLAISKIGTSTWTLSNSTNSFTGGTTFSGGTLVFANGALGTTGAITGSGGTLRWASGNTQDISSRLAMTAATSTFDTNGNNVTFASAIGSGVAAALTKTGTGTLTLGGTNTYTGSTTVNLGTLNLDYGTNDTTKLSNTTALVLGGGTVNLAGATGSHVEVVSATTLTAGTASYVTRTGLNTAVLQLGTITNNTGTLNIGGAGMATANNTHTAGTILGTWATIGGDWAITAASGTNIPITAYASYTDVNRLGGAIATGSSTNVRIIEAGVSGNISMAAGTTSINTLNQSATGGTATIDTASKILQTNGILMGPSSGALTIGTSASSGTLAPTATTGSIIVTNNSANTLTINSVIGTNSGGTTSLVKTGTGVLVLNGSNTYLGGTTLQDGTLRVGATVGSMNSNGILGGTFNNGLIIANKSTAVFDVNGQTAYIKDLQGGGSLGGNVTLGSGTLQIRNPSNAANPYSGIISGTGNLIVGDTSAWVTTSAHTYTGTTTVFSGAYYANILADGGIASGIGQSSSAASNLIINVGTLSYNGTSAASTNRQFTLAGNGGFGVQSTGAITWSYTGAVTYSGAGTKTLNFSGGGTGLGTLAASIGDNGGSPILVAKTGSSTWALSGANTYTGTTTVSSGTLVLDYASQNNSKLSDSAALILAGGTVTLSGGAHTEVVASTTLQANTTSNITRSSIDSVLQLGTITVNSNAFLNLGASGIATTNNTNNSLGVLGPWATIAGSGWAVNSTNGANGLITAATYTDVTRLSSGTKTIASDSSANYRIIEGTGTVGNVTMAAAGITSVKTLVNTATTAGSVDVGTGNTLATGAILQGTGAGTLTIGVLGATAGSLSALSAGGDLAVAANSISGLTINSVITDNSTSTLTKEGSGTVTLTGANTYAGGTTISLGVLAVGQNNGGVGGDNISPDGTSTSLGSQAVNVAAGTALHINTAGLTIANNITLNGLSYGVNSGGPAATNTGPWNGALMGASKTGVVSNTFSGTITLNATSNVTTNWSDKTMIITGKVTGAGGLTFDNSAPTARQGGLFRLSNTTNDYAGVTTINNGNTVGAQPTLILGASNVIPNGAGKGNVNVLGNLNLNGFSDTINGLSGSGVITSGVAGTPTLTVGDNNATGFTFSGIIQNGSGTVALTKIGTGSLTLGGGNTYSGNTTVNAGTLVLADNAQLKFVLGATSGSNNSISGAGTVTLNGDFVIDTTAADALASGTWTLESVPSLSGAYGSTFTVVGFTDAGSNKWTKPNGAKTYTFDETTGILTLASNNTYASWIATFPGVGLLNGVNDDPDNDGIDNGAEMVLGGNPATGMDTALLPTIELVTNPVSVPTIPAGNYLLFTYRRSDLSVASGVTADCQTDTDLVGTWTAATGAPGVEIRVDDNYGLFVPAATNTDRVRVYVPRGANPKFFGRLNVVVP